MTSGIQAALDELTSLPDTEAPLLSIYLDWTVDGSGRRPSVQLLEQRLDAIAQERARDPQARASIAADRERIMRYIADEAPEQARGLAIFACDAQQLWHALPLAAPVPTDVAADRFPHLFGLAHLADDHETYAVVLADGQDSRIFVIALGGAEKVAETSAAEPIKRFDQGGSAQMLFQRRTDNLIKAHTKDIAKTLGDVVARHGVRHIILSCNDSVKGIVMAGIPPQLGALVVDHIHLDKLSSLPAILEATEPLIRQAEEQQEAAAVAELEDQLATKGGLAVVGVAETAQALSRGQVRALLMLPSFGGAGGECESCGTLRAGDRKSCAACGGAMRPVELREAFAHRALQQSAEVQVVAASELLAGHDQVGALLRYRDASTPDQVITA